MVPQPMDCLLPPPCLPACLPARPYWFLPACLPPRQVALTHPAHPAHPPTLARRSASSSAESGWLAVLMPAPFSRSLACGGGGRSGWAGAVAGCGRASQHAHATA